MNNDGENGGGGGPHNMLYGQPQHLQVPPPQQQDANYSTTPGHPPQQQPQHAIPGTNPTPTFGAHSILMNNATAGNRRRPGEDDPPPDQLRTGMQPTPLFERLVTEEVQELKAYARIIENQNRRLAELERVHGDLEVRLEQECKARMRLEATLEQHELAWNERYSKLEKERDHWKEVVQLEQTKNSRLIEQVVRKEKDIQKMLQRKYDQPPREGAHYNQSGRSFRQGPNEKERSITPNSSSRSPSLDQQKSPHEILFDNGPAEAAHPNNDPDKPRSTSPESYREGFIEDHHCDLDASKKSLVLGSRVWEDTLTKSNSEILVVDEATVAEPATPERRPLVENVEDTEKNEEEDGGGKPTSRLSDSSSALHRLSAWSSSMRSSMISFNPLSRPAQEPPPDWEIPKPGFKHAETQTLI
ncbi:GCC2 and GCC3 [Seminavis robusta]|uniref:GCC2 and GCC3 n=1 Tax=Seminavis robusta TaxID=568900 RepID=A0A9N8DSC3_9STRA|nr:GCC2 and GCC3 [Seminavis robusta]|eukprot:Sro253_g099770.1 GCC2 and GCC3 (415) ;mRNA; r:14578-16007